MALTQQALEHYKSLIDSAANDQEKEELIAGIENHHKQDNYLVWDKAELRKIGQTALGVTPSGLPKQTTQEEKDARVDATGDDFLTGANRGLQNLQAMNYGGVALAGAGLKKIGLDSVGQSLQDFGMEGYRRNVKEAGKYEGRYSFKDVYTGKAGIGGAIDWAQGTLGELVPAMAEAAVGTLIGATMGSAAGPEGTIAGGAAGAFAGRTILKKAIEKGVQQAVKKGMGKEAESLIRKQVTQQALKKFGGKVGMGAATLPMEAGGMYADLLENKGIDAPGTALLFGTLSTALEYVGGNSKLVDTFVDALANGSTGLIKKTAKELIKEIPKNAAEEGVQEGFQEVSSILNTFVNTNEELLTADNIEQIVSSIAAGAVGGGAGGVVSGVMHVKADSSNPRETELTKRFDTIKANGIDKIPTSIEVLSQEIAKNNEMLQDKEALDALAKKSNNKVEDIVSYLEQQNSFNQELVSKLQTEIDAVANADPEAADIAKTVQQEQERIDAEQAKAKALDDKVAAAREAYLNAETPEKRAELETQLISLVNEQKALNDETKKEFKKTTQTPEQTPEQRQVMYETLDNEYLTQQGTPYKSRKVLEARIAELPDASNYVIANTPEGFIGIKKTSSFKNEQQVVEPNTVDNAQQDTVSTTELQNQLDTNEQQLAALTEQLNATTDPNERIALQQEGASLYEQNTLLKEQLSNQAQTQLAQEQIATPELNAENANINPLFQTKLSQKPVAKLSIPDIEKVFPNQKVTQASDGSISIRFKNGKGVQIQSMEDAGQGFIKMAIKTGQMKEDGHILGITVDNNILLDTKFADNKTLWHENKHVLDNLGMITQEDNNLLNAEFNRLRKLGKLNFELSTHEDSKQAMVENRANMFAQIMTDREAYRNKPLGKMIQRVMDFMNQLLALGKQNITSLAREVESGKIYERKVNNRTVQTTLPQAEVAADKWYSAVSKAINESNMQSAKAGRWYNQLMKYPEVKPTEMEWTGLKEYLQENPQRKITKEELQKWFAENQVHLEEVVNDKASVDELNKKLRPLNIQYNYSPDADQYLFFDLDGNFIENESNIPKDAYALVDKYFKNDATTEYDSYKTSGGSDYREFVLTWPKKDVNYYGQHFKDVKNPVVHIRTQIRTRPDGSRFLHVEEIQSDWDQEGQKKGFRSINEEISQDDLFNKINALGYHLKLDGNNVAHIYDANNRMQSYDSLPSNVVDLFVRILNSTLIPKNPWTEKSTLLAMKRMVRYAAENNLDAIAWSGADVQTARWGSEGFSWKKNADETFRLFGEAQTDGRQVDQTNRNGLIGANSQVGRTIESRDDLKEALIDIFEYKQNQYSPEKYKAYIDKQTDKLWQRMQENSDGDYFPRAEAFKQVYDKNLYNTLKKEFGRGKWGKPKFSFIEQDGLKLPSMEVTDRMKDRAMRLGMAQFQTALGNGIFNMPKVDMDKIKQLVKTDSFKKWFGKSKITSNGEPHIMYHGTADPKFLQDNSIPWIFDTSRTPNSTSSPLAGLGIFLANDEVASGYSDVKGTIHPFFVKIENPYVTTTDALEKQIQSPDEARAMQKRLKDLNGHDGIILKDSGYAIAFDPNQLKSATDNSGAFASNNPDVRFQVSNGKYAQKLSDTEYEDAFKERNNLFQNIYQKAKIRGSEALLIADKLTGTISTRLANANVKLRDEIRWLDFKTAQSIKKHLEVAEPLLDSLKNMSKQDKHTWKLARTQGDTGKINQLADKYNLTDKVAEVRKSLNDIRKQAQEVGYSVGFVEEYWPRIIKDTEGFLQATQGISHRAEFSDALAEKAKSMGITIDKLREDFPDVQADVISNVILGYRAGMGGPGNIKSRTYDKVPKNLVKYYMDPDAALMQYVVSMTKKIEARKFFGKVPEKIQKHKSAITRAQTELIKLDEIMAQPQENADIVEIFKDRRLELTDTIALHEEALNKYKEQNDYTENIGAYIADLLAKGELKRKDEKAVREILEARFNERGAHGITADLKNLAYIDVMGNFMSALTQLTDIVWGAYVGKVWTPKGFTNTTKNVIKAAFKNSNMTKEDVGFERIAQEFADSTSLSKAVGFVFDKVGLTYIDSIGKEVLLNNALDQYKAQVASEAGRTALAKQIRPIFGMETNQVLKDLASNTHSDNVKMLVYSRVLDFQPVALSEMPEAYLKAGNLRVFYMLKTFTLKQVDVFRNEVFKEISSGDSKRIVQGIKNMTALVSLLTLANASVDELKDFILGKETRFKDNVVENLMSLGGASRYMRMQVTREGIGSAIMQQILPPMKFVNALSSDIGERIATGDIEKGLRSVRSIPFAGNLWYWHVGRGYETKKSLNDKDFAQASKRIRKFKRQFDKADNKKLFLQTHVNEFKQMKLHQNFQTALNKNRAMLNKLKKLPQTPNVFKRIAQLEKQQELFYKRYFELAKQLEQ